MSGPEQAAWDCVDASGWLYGLERGADRRTIRVEVAGSTLGALRRNPASLAAETREAVETMGRSEVEKFLGEDVPPRRVSLTEDGYVVRR